MPDPTDPATARETRELDGAMHSVWLHGSWRWLTKNMTTPEKDAAADAVERFNKALNGDDYEPITGLRWWRD